MSEDKQRSPLHLLWLDKYGTALNNMEKAQENGSGILMEIAAQHPLKD